MSIFDRIFIKGEGSTVPKNWATLERRVGVLPSPELHSWAEQSLYAIGRNLSEYRKDPSRLEYLEEAVDGSRVLVRLIEEYRRRQ